MKKRDVKRFAVSHVPRLNPFMLKKISADKEQSVQTQIQINPVVAKWSFAALMILIFFALFFKSPSFSNVSSYSVIETVNPGLNLVIFLSLLALIFFLTYEKTKKSK
jgi:hypothetical protein